MSSTETYRDMREIIWCFGFRICIKQHFVGRNMGTNGIYNEQQQLLLLLVLLQPQYDMWVRLKRRGPPKWPQYVYNDNWSMGSGVSYFQPSPFCGSSYSVNTVGHKNLTFMSSNFALAIKWWFWKSNQNHIHILDSQWQLSIISYAPGGQVC